MTGGYLQTHLRVIEGLAGQGQVFKEQSRSKLPSRKFSLSKLPSTMALKLLAKVAVFLANFTSRSR